MRFQPRIYAGDMKSMGTIGQKSEFFVVAEFIQADRALSPFDETVTSLEFEYSD